MCGMEHLESNTYKKLTEKKTICNLIIKRYPGIRAFPRVRTELVSFEGLYRTLVFLQNYREV